MDFTSTTSLPGDAFSAATPQSAYIAHVRQADEAIQTVSEHLFEVAEIARNLAAKMAVPQAGELIGLLHDFGKYSAAFQTYIRTETGLLEPDGDDQPSQKGKIDHSTAGAQWLWQELAKFGQQGEGKLCAQILALCIASHHGGLIDNLSADGEEHLFAKRIDKADEKTHYLVWLRMVRVIVLQQLHGVSDEQMAFQLLDRQGFQRFVDTRLHIPRTPDRCQRLRNPVRRCKRQLHRQGFSPNLLNRA